MRYISGLNNASPKIFDIDRYTIMQPGSLITATELYLEYHSDSNDDGFEATITAQVNRKSTEINVLKTTTKIDLIKFSKILEIPIPHHFT